MSQQTVNLFFSCDDKYVPYLAVTLASIKENCDKTRTYNINILNTDISPEYKNRIIHRYCADWFLITFVDITEKLNLISAKLHTRDYYSKTTYYRLFIPELFPDLSKALYLDVDLVVCGDISQLFDTELSDNLVGAVTDGFVQRIDCLREYVRKRVGVERDKEYFNAGVLLMNLDAMRNIGFEKIFIEILEKVKFDVAQDQDYLNSICYERAKFLNPEWNCMPNFEIDSSEPKLIHYNLDNKPWHRSDVPYSDIFWEYAKKSGFENEIQEEHSEYTEEMIAKSKKETELISTAAIKESGETEENQRIHRTIKEILTRNTDTVNI